MNQISEVMDSTDPEKRVVNFATTPIMSTYLVAIVVGKKFD